MKPLCQLDHVTKEFTMGETIRPLHDLSLTVQPGDFIAIEGPSGTGKSTLLYVLGALLAPDSGTYTFEGTSLEKATDAQKAALRAQKIGFLFQESNLIQALTVRQNIAFVAKEQGIPDSEVDALIGQFGLRDRADHLPYQLSGGQRRRAGAVRALIHNPSLILADEPTNDLDDHWQTIMMQTLKERAKNGAAVVLVTHNHQLIKDANRAYRLTEGTLVPIFEMEDTHEK